MEIKVEVFVGMNVNFAFCFVLNTYKKMLIDEIYIKYVIYVEVYKVSK